MEEDDKFEGRSWLNILAAITLIAGLIFPMVSGIEFPTLASVLLWYAFVLIVTLGIAGIARTQERLARIEHHLGLTKAEDTSTTEESD